VTLGASPGDDAHPEPYLYVSPWETARPGDPAFWNAPFGALLDAGSVAATADPASSAIEFYRRGLQHLG
jgi:hypothetical protein